MTAEQAIERSISHDEIVYLDYSAEAEETLLAECDDSADCSGYTEYWGKYDDVGDWRVHMRHEVGVTITASISDGMSRNAGGETTITADALADAIEQAEEWVRRGSYTSADSDTVDVMLVIKRKGVVIDRRTVECDATRES